MLIWGQLFIHRLFSYADSGASTDDAFEPLTSESVGAKGDSLADGRVVHKGESIRAGKVVPTGAYKASVASKVRDAGEGASGDTSNTRGAPKVDSSVEDASTVDKYYCFEASGAGAVPVAKGKTVASAVPGDRDDAAGVPVATRVARAAALAVPGDRDDPDGVPVATDLRLWGLWDYLYSALGAQLSDVGLL